MDKIYFEHEFFKNRRSKRIVLLEIAEENEIIYKNLLKHKLLNEPLEELPFKLRTDKENERNRENIEELL